jgi:hypothetical protein
MDLMDLLKASGGESGLGQLAQTVGLGSSDTSDLVKALAPALMRGVQKNAAADAGAGLRKALETGGHERYIDNPELLASLAMGAMSKKTSGGRDVGPAASSGGLGSLGDLIGGLGGGSKDDGIGLDDVLGMARKFF